MKQLSREYIQQIFRGIALLEQLTDRCIKLAEMDVSYLDYQNWMRHGLLIEEQVDEKNTQKKLTYYEYMWVRMINDMSLYGISYKVIKNIKKEFVDTRLSQEFLDSIFDQIKIIDQIDPGSGQAIKNQNPSKLLDILDNISTPLHLILLYALVMKVDGRLLIEESGKCEIELDGFEEESNKIKCRPHLSIPISYMLSNYLKIDDIDCCIQLRKPLSLEEQKLIKIIRGRKFGELESISIGYKNGEMDLIKVRELKRTVIESRLIDHIQKGGYHNIEYKVQGGSLVHFVNERVIKV